jgi:hypothetical protein
LVSDVPKKAAKSKAADKKRFDTENANGSVGRALRTVYQQTVDEDIPAEMLDLLGKLG